MQMTTICLTLQNGIMVNRFECVNYRMFWSLETLFSITACGQRSVVKQTQCTHCPGEMREEWLCDFLCGGWCSLGLVCLSLHRFSCRAGTRAFSGNTHWPKITQSDATSPNTTTHGPSFARSAQPAVQEVRRQSEHSCRPDITLRSHVKTLTL